MFQGWLRFLRRKSLGHCNFFLTSSIYKRIELFKALVRLGFIAICQQRTAQTQIAKNFWLNIFNSLWQIILSGKLPRSNSSRGYENSTFHTTCHSLSCFLCFSVTFFRKIQNVKQTNAILFHCLALLVYEFTKKIFKSPMSEFLNVC